MSSAIVDHGTTRDGLIQLRRRWTVDGRARAAALVIHRLGQHSGRYEHVGAHLAAAGIETVAIDNRGFGHSGGRRAFVDRVRHRVPVPTRRRRRVEDAHWPRNRHS